MSSTSQNTQKQEKAESVGLNSDGENSLLIRIQHSGQSCWSSYSNNCLSYNHSIGCPTRFSRLVTRPHGLQQTLLAQKLNSIKSNDNVGPRNTIDRKVDTRRGFYTLQILHHRPSMQICSLQPSNMIDKIPTSVHSSRNRINQWQISTRDIETIQN